MTKRMQWLGIAGVGLSLGAGRAGAQSSAEPVAAMVTAAAYGGWSLPSLTLVPSAGTYVLKLDARLPPTVPGGLPFDPLVAGVPVEIDPGADAETVIPTRITAAPGEYDITVTLARAHPGRFTVGSGSGGLAEAIQALRGGGGTVLLDAAWNGQVSVGSVPGAANVQVVDIRQGHTIWYGWDGSAYTPALSLDPAVSTAVTLSGLVAGGPWYDPRAWGAKCDGTTDDTAAFAALVAYLRVHPGEVALPPSTCDLSQLDLTGLHGVTIQGRAATRADGSPAASQLRITGAAGGSCGNTGRVDTSGTAVSWVAGDQFGALQPGQPLDINNVPYIIASVTSPTALVLSTGAGAQTAVAFAYHLDAVSGGIVLRGSAIAGVSENISLRDFTLTTSAAPDCLLKIASDAGQGEANPSDIEVRHVSFANDNLSSAPVRTAIYAGNTIEDHVVGNDFAGCSDPAHCAFAHDLLNQEYTGSGRNSAFNLIQIQGNVFGSLAVNQAHVDLGQGAGVRIAGNAFEASGAGIRLHNSNPGVALFSGLTITGNWMGDIWPGAAGTAWITVEQPMTTSRVADNYMAGNAGDAAVALQVNTSGSTVTASSGTFQPQWSEAGINLGGTCYLISAYLNPTQVMVGDAPPVLAGAAAFVGQSGIVVARGTNDIVEANRTDSLNGCALVDLGDADVDQANYLNATGSSSAVLLSLGGAQRVVAANSFVGSYAAAVTARGAASGWFSGSLGATSQLPASHWAVLNEAGPGPALALPQLALGGDPAFSHAPVMTWGPAATDGNWSTAATSVLGSWTVSAPVTFTRLDISLRTGMMNGCTTSPQISLQDTTIGRVLATVSLTPGLESWSATANGVASGGDQVVLIETAGVGCTTTAPAAVTVSYRMN